MLNPTAANTMLLNDSTNRLKDNQKALLVHIDPSINLSSERANSPPLETLDEYVKALRQKGAMPEILANKYLEMYDKETKFIVKLKEISKFLPNINKSEKKVLELFGVTPARAFHPKNPKNTLFLFCPHQYILATMVNSVAYPKFEERIDFAFKMYDANNDGKINRKDLKSMFSMYGKESCFKLDDATLEAITSAICRHMEESDDGMITMEGFRCFFQNYRTKSIKINIFERRRAGTYERPLNALENELIRAALPANNVVNRQSRSQRCASFFRNEYQKRSPKVFWILLWGLGMIYFFTTTFIKFYDALEFLSAPIAKGSAAVINYNMAFMITLTTKSFTTAFRTIGLAKLLPVNINVYLHTRIGFTTLLAAWIHSLAHIFFVLRRLANIGSLQQLNSILFTPMTQLRPYTWWVFESIPGWTGIISLILLTILVLLAIKKLRQVNYERFWYTHMLWLPLTVLLCFHGMCRFLGQPHFYYWVGPPTTVLLLEKVWGFISYMRQKHKIIDMVYLDYDVIEVKVSKPAKFQFIPGQYAKIKIPEVSKLQWHPFSFSSCPYDEHLSFHISPVGDWTNELKQLALDYKAKKLSKLPTILLSGPYGAPSQHYSDYHHLMIISSGIGATPFSSILRYLNEKMSQETDANRKVKSVEFYWVNKKPTSHAWLTSLFKELQANEATKTLVKINMFFTCPHEKYDLRSFLFWRGIEILYADGVKIKGMEQFDLMKWGRPDWDDIFIKKAQEVRKGKVGVFFCGNHILSKELLDKSAEHSGDVLFDFQKEVF